MKTYIVVSNTNDEKEENIMEIIGNDLVQAILDDTNLGIWTIRYDVEQKKNQMILDERMKKMLSVRPGKSEEKTYDYWFRRILAEDSLNVLEAMITMISQEEYVSVEYLWNHPELGVQKYKMTGRLERVDQEGFLVLKGHCQNIVQDSDNASVALAQQFAGEKRRLWNVMKTAYLSEARIDIEAGTIKQTLFAEDGTVKSMRESDYEQYMKGRLEEVVEDSYRDEVAEFLDLARIRKVAEQPDGVPEESVRYYAMDENKESRIYENRLVYAREHGKNTVSLLLKDVTKQVRHEIALIERKKRLEKSIENMIDNSLKKDQIIERSVQEMRKYLTDLIETATELVKTENEENGTANSKLERILKDSLAIKEQLDQIDDMPAKL